jgi:hypothetical protein
MIGSVSFQFGRLCWWIQRSDNAAAATQALSALVTAAATVVLVNLTRKYVQVTRTLSEISARQLTMMAQPNVELQLGLSNREQPSPIRIEIRNKGDYPVKINKVELGWICNEQTLDWKSQEVRSLQDRVIPAHSQIIDLWGVQTDPVVKHLDSWSDSMSLTVDCADLAGITRTTFSYTPRTHMTGESHYRPD